MSFVSAVYDYWTTHNVAIGVLNFDNGELERCFSANSS